MDNVNKIVKTCKNIFHALECVAADMYYGFPGRKIIIIAITGTDGKTTTTELVAHILRNSGKKVAFISTINADINGKVYQTGFHTTTPRPWQVRKFIYQALKTQCQYFILESFGASSNFGNFTHDAFGIRI